MRLRRAFPSTRDRIDGADGALLSSELLDPVLAKDKASASSDEPFRTPPERHPGITAGPRGLRHLPVFAGVPRLAHSPPKGSERSMSNPPATEGAVAAGTGRVWTARMGLGTPFSVALLVLAVAAIAVLVTLLATSRRPAVWR